MSERIKPQIMVQHVEFLQRCLDGNLPALRTLHEICTEIAWLRGDVDVNWQSRALAVEQTLKQRDEEIVDREKIQQEQLKMLLEAEQERDQLKAELQQARERSKHLEEDRDFYRQSLVKIAEAMGIVTPLQLIARAENNQENYADILIRILKEKLQSETPRHPRTN